MENRPPERRKRSLKRRVVKVLKRAFVRVAVRVIPPLYLAYMWLVYKTSKVEYLGPVPSHMRDVCGGGVYAVWHDEVVFVAYAFGKFRPHTLASQSDLGELITRFLEKCGFQVFRGGSSSARKRRATRVLEQMIECFKTEEGVVFGITVDGSKGPIYRMKRGACSLSMVSGRPIGAQRTWCKRYLRLKTWDRTMVPLPFNHIVHAFHGPFYPPPADAGPEAERSFVSFMEGVLCRMSGWTRRYLEGKAPPNDWVELHPPEHREKVVDPGEIIQFMPVREPAQARAVQS